MKRFDPFTLPRKPAKSFTRMFTDPDVPDRELEITIRRLDLPQQMASIDAVESLAEKYIDGEDGMLPIPIPVGGEPVEVSRVLLQQCCFLERMQTAPVGERYGLLEWIALSVTMPAAFQAASKWAMKIQKAGGDLPNESAEGVAASLPPASASSSSIPSTSSEPTPSSGPSTNGWRVEPA